MGWFSRLGSRISSGLKSAARVGKKTLGAVSRVGNTIAHTAEKAVNVVDRIPIVGQVLSPLSGVVRSGIGLVKDVADAADAGKSLIEGGESILQSGDVSKVGGLVKDAKSKLEKGTIRQDTKNLMADVKKLTKDLDTKRMGREAMQLAKAEGQRRMGMS
jgi:hypothetical protein